ncbi:MAG: hypothetical protein ACI81W_001703, partial [Saprospiraceae bacterium]
FLELVVKRKTSLTDLLMIISERNSMNNLAFISNYF